MLATTNPWIKTPTPITIKWPKTSTVPVAPPGTNGATRKRRNRFTGKRRRIRLDRKSLSVTRTSPAAIQCNRSQIVIAVWKLRSKTTRWSRTANTPVTNNASQNWITNTIRMPELRLPEANVKRATINWPARTT